MSSKAVQRDLVLLVCGKVAVVGAKAFYLSQEQANEVNVLMEAHWERRMAEDEGIGITERPLTVNADMNDEYLID
ncbi:hypothetical protein H7J93_16520 [Mycobacterium barrassiae]|uniref:hypothetical protein n=1 Tax=Mycobacterium barrassiae TaxID=319709 RepID=UPI002265F39B|nr:hypothetical protein [Mycobacterium barrassiae]MCV7301225.1 hypothetical protein [Mycobacterium barrassiae]